MSLNGTTLDFTDTSCTVTSSSLETPKTIAVAQAPLLPPEKVCELQLSFHIEDFPIHRGIFISPRNIKSLNYSKISLHVSTFTSVSQFICFFHVVCNKSLEYKVTGQINPIGSNILSAIDNTFLFIRGKTLKTSNKLN